MGGFQNLVSVYDAPSLDVQGSVYAPYYYGSWKRKIPVMLLRAAMGSAL